MDRLWNHKLLDNDVQEYIDAHLKSDVFAISLSKSPFDDVTSAELATQIESKKKAEYKLPTWFAAKGVIYPVALSIEQTSSEKTASYKADLVKGKRMLDMTAGFGVDAFYFTKSFESVIACEINPSLSNISEHNATVLRVREKTQCIAVNGIDFIRASEESFDMVYVDPARRKNSGKVFKLSDCTPDVSLLETEILQKTEVIMIKTSPLLDITAGLNQLKHVAEIHIISVKNECKEVLWIIKKNHNTVPTIIAITINDRIKTFRYAMSQDNSPNQLLSTPLDGYLYEPDVALLKSGNFNGIGNHYNLQKLAAQTQLYFSETIIPEFPGRIFKIDHILTGNNLKGNTNWEGNVIVRNYPDKPENLVKKYKIKPSQDKFMIFTSTDFSGNIIVQATILQHY